MKHFQMYSPAVTRTISTFFILLALVVLLIERVDAADRLNVVLISVDDLNDSTRGGWFTSETTAAIDAILASSATKK